MSKNRVTQPATELETVLNDEKVSDKEEKKNKKSKKTVTFAPDVKRGSEEEEDDRRTLRQMTPEEREMALLRDVKKDFHCCFDVSDISHLKRLNNAQRRLTGRFLSNESFSKKEYDETTDFAAEEVRKYCCTNMHLCVKKANTVIVDHGICDFSMYDIATLMMRHNAVSVVGYALFTPEMIRNDNGVIPNMNAVFEIDRKKDILIIRFLNDRMASRSYTYSKYMTLFMNSFVPLKKGGMYIERVDSSRGCMFMYKAIYIHDVDVISNRIPKHRIWTNVGEKVYLLRLMKPKQYGLDLTQIVNYEWTEMLVEKRLFDEVVMFANRLDKKKFTLSAIRENIGTVAARHIINIKDVTVCYDYTPQQKEDLALFVLFYSFVQRYNTSVTVNEVLNRLNGLRNFGKSNVFYLAMLSFWNSVTRSAASVVSSDSVKKSLFNVPVTSTPGLDTTVFEPESFGTFSSVIDIERTRISDGMIKFSKENPELYYEYQDVILKPYQNAIVETLAATPYYKKYTETVAQSLIYLDQLSLKINTCLNKGIDILIDKKTESKKYLEAYNTDPSKIYVEPSFLDRREVGSRKLLTALDSVIGKVTAKATGKRVGVRVAKERLETDEDKHLCRTCLQVFESDAVFCEQINCDCDCGHSGHMLVQTAKALKNRRQSRTATTNLSFDEYVLLPKHLRIITYRDMSDVTDYERQQSEVPGPDDEDESEYESEEEDGSDEEDTNVRGGVERSNEEDRTVVGRNSVDEAENHVPTTTTEENLRARDEEVSSRQRRRSNRPIFSISSNAEGVTHSVPIDIDDGVVEEYAEDEQDDADGDEEEDSDDDDEEETDGEEIDEEEDDEESDTGDDGNDNNGGEDETDDEDDNGDNGDTTANGSHAHEQDDEQRDREERSSRNDSGREMSEGCEGRRRRNVPICREVRNIVDAENDEQIDDLSLSSQSTLLENRLIDAMQEDKHFKKHSDRSHAYTLLSYDDEEDEYRTLDIKNVNLDKSKYNILVYDKDGFFDSEEIIKRIFDGLCVALYGRKITFIRTPPKVLNRQIFELKRKHFGNNILLVSPNMNYADDDYIYFNCARDIITVTDSFLPAPGLKGNPNVDVIKSRLDSSRTFIKAKSTFFTQQYIRVPKIANKIDPVPLIESKDPIGDLQSEYDKIFPGVSLTDYGHDAYRATQGDIDVDVTVPELSFNTTTWQIPKSVPAAKSYLRTAAGGMNAQTPIGIMGAAIQRNLDVEYQSTPQNVYNSAVEIISNAAKLIFSDDYLHKFVDFDKDDVDMTAVDDAIDEYLSKQKEDTLKQIALDELRDEDIDFCAHAMMNKGTSKPKLDGSIVDKIPAIQTVVYNNPVHNAVLSPYYEVLTRRFQSILRPCVHLFMRKSAQELEEILQSALFTGAANVTFGDADGTKYDKSQQEFALILEMVLYSLLGFKGFDYKKWFDSIDHKKMYAYRAKMRMRLAFQRSSGNRNTAGGNSIVMLLAVFGTLKLTREQILAVINLGDDIVFAIQGALDMSGFDERVGSVMNINVKLTTSHQGYILGHYILQRGNDVKLMYDVMRKVESLGRRDTMNKEKMEATFTSFKDNISTLDDETWTPLLQKAIEIRNPQLAKVNILKVCRAMKTLSRNKESYMKLYGPLDKDDY